MLRGYLAGGQLSVSFKKAMSREWPRPNVCHRNSPRPEIKLPELITDNLTEGFKLTDKSNLDEMWQLWDKVTEQVKNSGLELGVYADLPERGAQRFPNANTERAAT